MGAEPPLGVPAPPPGLAAGVGADAAPAGGGLDVADIVDYGTEEKPEREGPGAKASWSAWLSSGPGETANAESGSLLPTDFILFFLFFSPWLLFFLFGFCWAAAAERTGKIARHCQSRKKRTECPKRDSKTLKMKLDEKVRVFEGFG